MFILRKKMTLCLATLVLSLVSAFDLFSSPKPGLQGVASWYSEDSPGVGEITASGERFNDSQNTCASWRFNFGTNVRVRNLANGKWVICRVNDRGPAKRLKRLIDLTPAAFRQIADLKQGLIQVGVTPV
ncbi:MAG: septal ring lytic transglycosylase RlpA family lipoprotein [Candidatus Omnitrophica bacterium]|nr:septal ring lytic transglycosylase RlpA family lipoprotein [Candidatus Omnitrophota bacterium]